MDEKDILDGLRNMVSSLTGNREISIQSLAQSGSNRRYYRLCAGDESFIGTFVPDPAEGLCFVELARNFIRAGRSVPEILSVSSDCRLYVQEDLGDTSLFSTLSSPEAKEYLKDTLIRLVELQKTPEDIWRNACLSGAFSRRQVLWDLNYFKYEYMKPREIAFDEERLEDDFQLISERLTSIPDKEWGFMMRDCQSRNVMITKRGPVFIDFQGGRRGPALYDAVSMLWQARAGFDSKTRYEMLDFYCDSFCDGDDKKKQSMLSWLDDMVLFRTLQVLGAYGFRGLVQRKAHFLMSIPGALANLRDLVSCRVLDRYPELKRCSLALTETEPFDMSADSKRLTVEVFSFSYKKGYPEDLSGNGGGFMFDCRALHNPGRYACYRSLTGRDEPVIRFLEERGEVSAFLKAAWTMTDAAVERYVTRGFTRLQIGFGCTGGQHRSVYSAERTADHIKEIFPEVNVSLIHREHPEA